jgi:ankyrin repeat protein
MLDEQNCLDTLYLAYKNEQSQPNTERLCTTFQRMLEMAGEVRIILDALDECSTGKKSEGSALLTWIKGLYFTDKNVSILVTSRPEQQIESSITSWAEPTNVILLQGGQVHMDICQYIHDRVHNHEGLSRWNGHPDVQKEIELTLMEKADDMYEFRYHILVPADWPRFRWVTCQLDTLEDCLDYRALQRALKVLPRTLDETYTRILENIPPDHLPYTKRLLQLLAFSERPLRIEEVVDAIAVDLTERPRFRALNRMPVPREISRYCSSLAAFITTQKRYSWSSVDEEIIEIQLSHFSVKEWLVSDRLETSLALDFEATAAHAAIAVVCLAYFLALNHSLTIDETKQAYPFATYSAERWAVHAAKSRDTSELVTNMAMELFSSKALFERTPRLLPSHLTLFRCGESALLFAAGQGLLRCSQQLIDECGADVNALPIDRGGNGTALQAASYAGHEAVVQLLLEKGADVNAPNYTLGTALQLASSKGHGAIVQRLLDKDADANAAPGECFGTALKAAATGGHTTVVQQLLKKGADADDPDALLVASFLGHKAIVQLLLEKGADANAPGNDHKGTMLQAASAGGHEAIVRLLLEKGADVNVHSNSYWGTALQAASRRGDMSVVQLLLEKGADVNAPAGNYGTALQATPKKGHISVVQLLQEKGADVNGPARSFGTALQLSSRGGHGAIVQRLLDKGANVNAPSGEHGTALQAASTGGHEAIVRLLLEKGSEVNAPGNRVGTALQAASRKGHTSVVQLLLEQGANANASYGRCGTALQTASAGGHGAIVRLLLERDADMNATGGSRHGTALQAASFEGHISVVQLLLEKGADVNAPAGNYGTALQAASEGGHEDIVRLLREKASSPPSTPRCW